MQSRGGPLRFVVQRHAATRLHYDLRLEMDGVLKSWAVPKGPSLDPSDKRLAVRTEDHPLEYRTFAGVIPKGHYGAGVVELWDEGGYSAPDTIDREAAERALLKGLAKGHIDFVLAGERLKGAFALVKTKKGDEDAWLLTKKEDAFAQKKDARFTHLSKVYWPEEGYTKGDLIAYYRDIAPVMLPYVMNRPQTLHRHPDGIAGEHFFQKEKNGGYILVQDEDSLLDIVNLGCIEIHVWNSRVATLDHPDYVVIDLDPHDTSFAAVIEVARAVRALLDDIGARGFCKTSGSRGLHVYVPLAPVHSYEQVRLFAEAFSTCLRQRHPGLVTLERMPARRGKRVYLDYLQNRRGQTTAAVYCVRPRAKAPVSTPLQWNEVNARLDPTAFTMRTLPARLDKKGDLWSGFATSANDLVKCSVHLAHLLETHQSAS